MCIFTATDWPKDLKKIKLKEEKFVTAVRIAH